MDEDADTMICAACNGTGCRDCGQTGEVPTTKPDPEDAFDPDDYEPVMGDDGYYY